MNTQQPPQRFGRYLLVERIATGGMGEVHLAKLIGPHGFEKLVVIKRLLDNRQSHQKYVEMFFHEARLAAQLNHSRIVQVFEAGEIDAIPFMAMEYVAGKSLRKLLDTLRQQHQRLAFEHIVDLFAQICDGLAFAHQAEHFSGAPLGLIHRDINPHNLLISFFGELKIIDFGIAKSDLEGEFTVAGTIKGTVSYMSPEQSLGQKLDQRSDLYSLGICLYEALTGNNPFQKETLEASLLAIQQSIVPPLALMRSDAVLFQPILDHLLAVNAQQRFAKAELCAAQLRALPLPKVESQPNLGQLMQQLFKQALQHEATRLEWIGSTLALGKTDLTLHEVSKGQITVNQGSQELRHRAQPLDTTKDLKAPHQGLSPTTSALAVDMARPPTEEPTRQILGEGPWAYASTLASSPAPPLSPAHLASEDEANRLEPSLVQPNLWGRLVSILLPAKQLGKAILAHTHWENVPLLLLGLLLGYGLQAWLGEDPPQSPAKPPAKTSPTTLIQQRDNMLVLQEKAELLEPASSQPSVDPKATDKPEEGSKSSNGLGTPESEASSKGQGSPEEPLPRRTNRFMRNMLENKGPFQLQLESAQDIILSLDGRILNSSLIRSNKGFGKIGIKDKNDPNCAVQLAFSNNNPLRLQLFVPGLQIFDVRDSAGQKIGTIGTTPFDINYHKRPINLGLILVERGGTCQLRLFFREPER